MINKMNAISTKMMILPLFLSLSLSAGTYDDNYSVVNQADASVVVNDSKLMHGNFQEIIRFDMLSYSASGLDNDSEKTLKKIVDTYKVYKDAKITPIVSIIGHTREVTDNANEKTIDASVYANQIQNWFRTSHTTAKSDENSKEYALDARKLLVDNGIDTDTTIVEYRGGQDLGFTNETREGMNLSNRVMVAFYIPKTVKVPVSEVALDSDKDGVVDAKDKCPNTPVGTKVDADGCPLDNDSDKDGIIDSKDLCPNTPIGTKVDENGCPLMKTLALHFKTASHEILSSSNAEISEFATFMKNNTAYKAQIIGHTDNAGKAPYNMTLSQNRAKSTKAALVAQGVSADRLTTLGRGLLEPVATNSTEEGRLTNRRIEVKLSH